MDDSTLKDTLAKLRNRSWEMELLISGFVLVLLLPVPDIIREQGSILLANMSRGFVQQLITITVIVSWFGSRILIANLIIYLFLRGFWIGIVGLASAFPKGVDWVNTTYQKTYQQYLAHKTLPTESYINILNKITSSVFSFSFLLVFLTFAFFLGFLPAIIIDLVLGAAISSLPETHWISQSVGVTVPIISLIYLSSALIFLMDFLTLGLIKRLSWRPFVKLYFPIYRFFRWLTLAPLYTPIYYTLISNVPKRIITLVLISYLAIFLFFTNVGYSEEIFYPSGDNAYQIQSQHYEDQNDTPYPTRVPLIPSDFIAGNYLRLFLPYLVSDNDSIQQACPEVEVFRESGFATDMQVTLRISPPDTARSASAAASEENVLAALNCLANEYQIYVDDSLYQPETFYFYRRVENDQPGLLTYLPLASLPSGPHQLTVKKRDYSSIVPNDYATYYIPFVKE